MMQYFIVIRDQKQDIQLFFVKYSKSKEDH